MELKMEPYMATMELKMAANPRLPIKVALKMSHL
jgi:hypothetical protein